LQVALDAAAGEGYRCDVGGSVGVEVERTRISIQVIGGVGQLHVAAGTDLELERGPCAATATDGETAAADREARDVHGRRAGVGQRDRLRRTRSTHQHVTKVDVGWADLQVALDAATGERYRSDVRRSVGVEVERTGIGIEVIGGVGQLHVAAGSDGELERGACAATAADGEPAAADCKAGDIH